MPHRFLLLILLAVLVGCGGRRPPATPAEEPAPDLDYPVGEFAFVDQDGNRFTDKDLRGKVWVASFVFTRCAGPCPSVSATMTRLQAELPDDPANLKLVTFTVDPDHDSPDELKQYAKARGADPRRWVFLTGDRRAVDDLMRSRFKLAVERKDVPDPGPGRPVDHDAIGHGTRLFVVDRAGVIRGSYDGLADDRFPDAAERFEQTRARLREKVGQLLAGK